MILYYQARKEKVKEDLEVLEIIRKKRVNVLDLKILQFGVLMSDAYWDYEWINKEKGKRIYG